MLACPQLAHSCLRPRLEKLLAPEITIAGRQLNHEGLTFDQIVKAIGKDEVWLVAAVLDIPAAQALSQFGSHWWPNRATQVVRAFSSMTMPSSRDNPQLLLITCVLVK
ncbi:hypothetical protein AX17_004687 [Amanita inopinata Kibby_2008]|nr:hypothetical protein AX17_004687 [Amanita inopinata Kibby_2008]